MSSRLNLLPVPAADGILEGCSLVVGKEVPDVLIIFELRFYLLWVLNGMIESREKDFSIFLFLYP